MKFALIGFTGFVGSTLMKQTNAFNYFYRSTNIADIDNETFDTVVCSGASAQKWLANLDPETDIKNIENLISHLKTVQCKTFILISTVDVFQDANGVDENTSFDASGLHPYGKNRRRLEQFVEEHFSNHLIVRLPGLVGPGLRKNVIYDFLNANNLHAIDSRGVFQFYPMVNLWSDIQLALHAGLKLVHLTAEPISVARVSQDGFGTPFTNELSNTAATYDMQTLYAEALGGRGRYQYSSRETVQAIRAYAQSEALTIKREIP